MPTQTSYFQQDIIRGAQQSNTLGDLYWYVEAEFPRNMLHVGIKRRQPARYPYGCIPVLPVGDDADVSRTWAEMLAEMFTWDNRGRGIVFAPALTSRDLLNDLSWYEYGDALPPVEIDHVCSTCGQVHRGLVGQPPRCECYEW
jgi:hypothetical protein